MSKSAAVVVALAVGCALVTPLFASGSAAAATPVAGRMLTAPGSDALVRRLPVRVAVTVPASTSRLTVRAGRRDVTARLRAAGGSRRVADLTLRDGLRFGANRLTVVAERRGRRSVIHARSFFLARSQPGLVRLRLRPGPITTLSVGVAAARRAAIRRERTVRLSLNGRPVTRALDRTNPTRWTASLSATYGLRQGVNRLRMLVAEPKEGRYALLRRRFVVPRDRHLASAGVDLATTMRGAVRLDGRRSRAAAGASLRHHWRIISSPRGSRARLRHAGSARPVLTPDRPGRYVVGLATTELGKVASAAQAGASSADQVTVTAGPDGLLLPFKGLTKQGGLSGIQVGDTFYPNPSPDGGYLQWLTLDRATLTPKGTGNSWFDGSATGRNGLDRITTAVNGGGLDDLVIFSFPYQVSPYPPVQPNQMDGFNAVLKSLGVGPIDNAILGDRNKLAIVGVPYGGDGSGWYTHGGGNTDALTGWLMPDTTREPASKAFRFRFQSDRPKFDTSVNPTPTTNRMLLGGQTFDAALPAGATGGFQVIKLDPIDFTPNDQAVYAVNGVSGQAGVAALQSMTKLLRADTWRHVVVQSIGAVSPPSVQHSPYEEDPGAVAWRQVRNALTAYGANPQTFAQVDGRYAFVGGSNLGKTEVAQSSSTVVADPSKAPPVTEPGTLRGRTSIRRDGYVKPLLSNASSAFDLSLYDIAFQAPTPWKYTAAAGEPDADDYAEALAYITAKLGFNGWGGDLRRAYAGNDTLSWSDAKTDLGLLPYPGDGRTCTASPGRDEDDRFSRKQFCNLSRQLQGEFDDLDSVKGLFDAYEAALNRSGNKQLVDLHSLGEKIRTSVEADGGAEIAWSVGAFLGNLTSAGLVLAPQPELLVAWEALVTAYELVRELVSSLSGIPVGDQVKTKVDDLSSEVATKLSDTAGGLDRLRDVIISDPGRLHQLGSKVKGPGWAIDPSDTSATLTTAANASFSTELLPVAFRPWRLVQATNFGTGTTDGCYINGYGHSFRGAPATSWMTWLGSEEEGGGTQVWALGKNRWTVSQYAYPPEDLSNEIFRSTQQGGFGVRLDRFFWEQYKDPGSNYVNCR